jgi:hypothetical protein
MRFHDLRHTTATLLLRAGVAPHLAQRILRHQDLRTTLGTYSHLDVDDLRGALKNLPTVDPPDDAKPALEAEAATGTDQTTKVLPFFYPASTGAGFPKQRSRTQRSKRAESGS